MSDLIEQLRRYRTSGVRMASPSICKEAADKLEAMQAEIARLRGLVERAYMEGFGDGYSSPKTRSEMWERSKSRKALEQKPSPELPSDVVRLIIAARTMAFGDWYSESEGYEVARKELDDAAEAFASRVEWPDTPSEQEGGE